MAKTKPLLSLLKGLRAELRHALSPNLNIESEERFTILLNNIEEELWMEFDWDHLKVYRYIAVRAGERYYDFPSDLDETRTYKWEYKFNTIYHPLAQGISRRELASIDSERGQRSNPLIKFDFHHDDATDNIQFEVWPTPSTDGTIYDNTLQPAPVRETEVPNRNADGNHFIRIRGIKNLTPMEASGDLSSLDGRLIELVAAASEAQADKSAHAAAISARAEAYKRKLIGRLKKTGVFLLGTDMDQRRTIRRGRKNISDVRFSYGPNSVL